VEAALCELRMTRIVVAHRLTTVADADLIVVLDGGAGVETGSPADLLQRDGRYAAMVRGAQVAQPVG